MYQNTFWDTQAGQDLVYALKITLPIIAGKKQFIEKVSREDMPEYLQEQLENGYLYIHSFPDPVNPAYMHIILEK